MAWMMVKGKDLDEIRHLPITDVAARLNIKMLRGNRAMCFRGHDKRTPSLSFWPAKNSWKCFGCGLGGSVIDLVMEVRQVDFKAALDWFALEFGLAVRRGRAGGRRNVGGRHVARLPRQAVSSREVPAPRSEFATDPDLYAWFLDRCGQVSQNVGVDYLFSHGISLGLAERFGVRELRDPVRAFRCLVEKWGSDRVFRSGLAFGRGGKPHQLIWTSYTLVFPFYSAGTLEYLQGRQFAREPKFLNPKGIPKPLYNLDRILSLPAGSVVHLCEGVPGALALETLGLPAAATLGASSFRAEWVDYFMPYDIVLLPDGDRGGDTFRRTIARLFATRAKGVRVVCPEAGKDVADIAARMRVTACVPS